MFRVRGVERDGDSCPVGVPNNPTDDEMVKVMGDCTKRHRLVPGPHVNRASAPKEVNLRHIRTRYFQSLDTNEVLHFLEYPWACGETASKEHKLRGVRSVATGKDKSNFSQSSQGLPVLRRP